MMQLQKEQKKERKFGQKEGYNKAKAEYEEKVTKLKKQKEDMVKELIKRGMKIEEISKIADMTEDEIRKITNSLGQKNIKLQNNGFTNLNLKIQVLKLINDIFINSNIKSLGRSIAPRKAAF